MKIEAKVVADSMNEYGNRLTTLLVTMPRYILAEFNTHRMLSKNSASSRAIPFEKNLKSVMENPFIPVAWMKNHSGMQGNEYFTSEIIGRTFGVGSELMRTDNFLKEDWLMALHEASNHASMMNKIGLTKQLCNRLLEPFMWHTVLVSATEWENFFALRCPDYAFAVGKGELNFRSRADAMKNYSVNELYPDMDIDNASYISWSKYNRGKADIHMMLTAEAIWDAMNESTPKQLKAGEWHIPFGDDLDTDMLGEVPKYKIHVVEHKDYDGTTTYIPIEGYDVEPGYYTMRKVKIATARAAQTSYTVIGEDQKELNYTKLIALHDRLSKSGHWSPFEHCAKAIEGDMRGSNVWSGNFRGFTQYRKMFPNENITKQ